jgi:hypothetical protein
MRAAWIGIPLGLVGAVLFLACGAERPDGAGGDLTPNGFGASCETPNEGCECIEPGKTVECGVVKHSSTDGFVACSMGHRTCAAGRWRACIGETDVVRPRTFAAGGGPIGTLALGAGAKCGAGGGGPANPCDPYCNAFVDDPAGLVLEGGLVVTADGGLSISPTSDGGLGGGGFESTAGGVSSCGGANNIVAASCTPPGLTACQQDFRCDVMTSRCIWNGGPGYYNAAAGGPDLTVGAPCGPSGSSAAAAPVCNRGSAPVPAGATITFHVTSSGSPPDGCTNLGAPTYTRTLAAALAPGACTSFILGNSLGNKMITINAGAPGAVTEGAGLCANNSAAFKDDGAPSCGTCNVCDTRVTGKVYDPSGVSPAANANNVPLSGVTVFQPANGLKPFTDGVQCDTCASLATQAQTETVTDATGSFTLTNVSPGTNIPIVVQSGRWRRTVQVNVPACATTAIPNGTLRMPKNRTEGDIPKTALVMGGAESLECWLRRVGIDATEMRPRTGAGDLNRIQLYRSSNASNYAINTSPASPSVSTLYAAGGPLNEYASTILSCDGGDAYTTTMYTSSASDRARLRDYADLGGRVFADHWPGQVFLRTGASPFNSTTVSTWQDSAAVTSPTKAKVLTGSAPQTTFRDWLGNVGASTDYGVGWVRVDTARKDSVTLGSGSVEWLRGQSANNWAGQPGGDYSVSFSFETPLAAASKCGRVLFNDMHVSIGRVNGIASYPIPGSKTFPADCSLGAPLSAEEKALEFQFFQLTACQLGGSSPPPPPPPPAPLPVVTFQRDYLGVCGTGERVKWGPLYWQSLVPPLTSIDFRAATASSIAALPSAPPAAAPVTAVVGKALATVPPPAWDCNGCPGSPVSVDSQLIAQTGTPSKEYLRVFMTFNPTASVPPTLLAWRQIYDCVPAE